MSLPPPPPPAQPTVGAGTGMLPRCYRHPDREAGRSCTRCGKSACSECLVQAAVGSHCVDCAKAARPPVATRAKYWNARQHTLVTVARQVLKRYRPSEPSIEHVPTRRAAALEKFADSLDGLAISH